MNSAISHYSEIIASRRNWILFFGYVKITGVVIGGGYAIIAAAQEEFAHRRKWLSEDDILEMITVTQTVPGILACNSAIYIGWRINKFAGALCALFGAILPSLIIIVAIAAAIGAMSHFIDNEYVQGAFRGVIAGIVGLVIVTALKMRKKALVGAFGRLIAIGCLIGMCVFKVNPAWLIVASIALGIVKVAFKYAEKRP
ncbi:MAG: chromate transporter [Victivallales bacterium]|jgi:chromate transporter|nr:chromate transporter [Victivallales bacterium]